MEEPTFQNHVVEVFIRFFLFAVYIVCEFITPFTRIVHPEEIWLYKFPRSESYIPMPVLWFLALMVPFSVILLRYSVNKSRTDLTEALWCFSFIISLNGAITNSLKIMVGRPRPDFLERCFPEGNYEADMVCTGDRLTVIDGRKSFPSGHSSVAFASFGFLALYLAGKLRLLTPSGKSSSVRILAVIAPVFFAVCVAISRTCDYHHHWQDVLVGSLLGSVVAYLCYFQYYPPLTSDVCDIPWKTLSENKQDATTRVKEI